MPCIWAENQIKSRFKTKKLNLDKGNIGLEMDIIPAGLLLNKGVVYKGYHCDEARTFVVGAPTQKQIECYDYVQKALDLLIKTVKPGIKISELYLVANRYMSETPYHKYFMTKAFYDYGWGGIDIEDTVVVTEDGCEVLTLSAYGL